MSEIYNVTQLTDGTNIVEWSLIINSWTDGLLFSAIFASICLLIFGIMRIQKVDLDDSMIAAGFIGFLITGVAWVIRWEGYSLVPTALPIMLSLVFAAGAFMKIVRGWLKT